MREFIDYMENLKEVSNCDTKLLLDDLIAKAEKAYSKILWDSIPTAKQNSSTKQTFRTLGRVGMEYID